MIDGNKVRCDFCNWGWVAIDPKKPLAPQLKRRHWREAKKVDGTIVHLCRVCAADARTLRV